VDLDNNNHSVFLMYYHLVLVVKYRRKVIDDTEIPLERIFLVKEFLLAYNRRRTY
jgi:REP element-mobilizing transposase RayT